MNNCSFIGRLTADPELKQTNSGLSVCSFSIAVDRPGSKERKVDFIPATAWRQTAEFIARYFKKGQKIGVTGSMIGREWKDKYDQKRISLELVVDRAEFCEKSENASSAPAPASAAPAAAAPVAPAAAYNLTPASQMGGLESFEELEEDDLPF